MGRGVKQQEGRGKGSVESSSAYIRFVGAKGLQAVIPLPVGMGSGPLDPGHQMRQALQACCCLLICHMQPGLHKPIYFWLLKHVQEGFRHWELGSYHVQR